MAILPIIFVMLALFSRGGPEEEYGCAAIFHDLGKTRARDGRGGLVSFDELTANSVNELGEAFLAALASEGGNINKIENI